MKYILTFIVLITASYAACLGQDRTYRDSVISAAREIIGGQKYCALITIDSSGKANIRTMNPFSPDEDMVVWMATNSRSRKIKEIIKNPNVVLYYANHAKATGYVSIIGKAVLVDEMQEKMKRRREYWSEAFPDWKYLILIKVIPERLEVINYKYGFSNSSENWDPASIEFK